MSLNYDPSKVTDWDKISSASKEAVCFATMSLGINEITAETLDEWLDRARVREAWHGAALFNHDDPKHKCLLCDREFMTQFIGLRTNASTVKSMSRWIKTQHDNLCMTREWNRRNAS
jgi:hypothetical protein